MDSKRRRKNAGGDAPTATEEVKTGRAKRGAAAKKADTDAPADAPVIDSADTQPEPKARGRGRPKKVEQGGGDAASAPAPKTEEKPAGRGKRGAPKKKEEQSDNGTNGNDSNEAKPSAEEPKRRGRKRKADTASDSKDTADSAAADAPAPRKGRGKSKKAATNDDKDDEEEEDEEKPSKSAPKEMKTITIKGNHKAPVDETCPIRDSAHVFSSGNDIYDVMLNQTNVQNNNNKYYVIQLLEDDTGNGYSVWQRWGRVGYGGQSNLDRCGNNLDRAKKVFCKKFYDKTGNQWADRANFSKVGGKYDLVKIDYSSKDEEIEEKVTEPKKKDPPPPSKLPISVQELLNMICDIKAMETAVKEMKYDASKAPLGKLTKEQIIEGYAALKEIEACIEKKNFGSALTQACNDFYTRIPHYFGMKTPPLIKTEEEIKMKIDLLEALSDIEVAIRTLAEGDKETDNISPIDKHYDAMKCALNPMDHDSETFKLLEKYLLTTHGSTHSMYKLELMDVFECEKDGEDTRYKDVGNRMLLWHGSRLTNWFGILSQGLRIAPPEAPCTGYMFGKGVYFADMSSKSANYCFTNQEKNVGLLVLCEVSLGKTRDLRNADYNANKLPAGCSSTKGLGRTVPDPDEYVTLENGLVVPCGKPKDINSNTSLQYNEYIVYDTSQIKMKYLMKVKFNYKF